MALGVGDDLPTGLVPAADLPPNGSMGADEAVAAMVSRDGMLLACRDWCRCGRLVQPHPPPEILPPRSSFCTGEKCGGDFTRMIYALLLEEGRTRGEPARGGARVTLSHTSSVSGFDADRCDTSAIDASLIPSSGDLLPRQQVTSEHANPMQREAQWRGPVPLLTDLETNRVKLHGSEDTHGNQPSLLYA